VVSIVAWFPYQQVAYLLPFVLFGAAYLLKLYKGDGKKLPRRSFGILLLLALLPLLILHSKFYETSYWSPLLWLFTHGYLFFFIYLALRFPARAHVGVNEIMYFIRVNLVLGVLEALVGTAQFFIGPSFADTAAAGDYVLGTLGNNSHLFAMKMLFLSILAGFAYAKTKSKWYLLALFIMLQAWLLGSALHTLLVIGFAAGMYVLLRSKNVWSTLRTIVISFSFMSIIIASLYLVQENNMRYFENKLSLENTAAPVALLFGKVALYKRTMLDIPVKESIDVVLFGFGPGSYSSRSSWMLSGHYLGNQSIVPVAPSHAWQAYMSDLWDTELLKRYKWMQGVANQPFSTWMTVLGEFGWLGLIVFVFFTLKAISIFKQYGKTDIMARCALFVWLFVLASFFFDNWDEYPRFFLPVILFLFMVYKSNDNPRVGSVKVKCEGV